MWLARNKTGTLTAHAHKPIHGDRNEGYDFWESYTYDNISLPMSQFPEVTFENSPIEVTSLKEVKIKD
jgi:hypothetical protein